MVTLLYSVVTLVWPRSREAFFSLDSGFSMRWFNPELKMGVNGQNIQIYCKYFIPFKNNYLWHISAFFWLLFASLR